MGIDRTLEYIKTQSFPKQIKPYPKLVEVTMTHPSFEFHNITGTIIGFRIPDHVNRINVPGYHFHFLTGDKKAGGN